ncbi:hypothetical protein CLAIMM_00928 [Cladophialophora immunda]|nr:hypothetical protein CLAIMM_00928 [Cladophialophora immunda]
MYVVQPAIHNAYSCQYEPLSLQAAGLQGSSPQTYEVPFGTFVEHLLPANSLGSASAFKKFAFIFPSSWCLIYVEVLEAASMS